MWGSEESFAYDGGLLQGLAGYNSSTAANTTLATDNNTSTNVWISYNGARTLTYTLPAAAHILSWRAQDSGGGMFRVNFYNAAGTVIYTSTNYNSINTTVSVNVQNVKKVVISNSDTGSSTYVHEFDVFGEYVFPIPSNLRATPQTKAIVLNWDDVPDTGHEGYVVYMDNQLITETPVTAKTYTVENLVPDELHSFYVKSVYTSNLYSQMSSEISSAAYGDPLLKPVLTGMEYEDRIDLTWTAVDGAVNYRLQLSNGQVLYLGDSKTFSHTGLPLETTYSYYVSVLDKYGRWLNSDEISLKTREPPEPVFPVLEALNVTYDTVLLRWTKLTAPYTLYQDGEIVSSAISSNSFIFSGTLEPDTVYAFKIGYTDIYGRYIESTTTDVTTASLPAPLYPVLEANTITYQSLRLKWNQVGVSYYVLQDGVEIKETTSTFNPVYDLTESTTYTYQVVSIDTYGRENASNVVSVTTLAKPPPPTEPPPTASPPPVSNSGNPDLNKANDQLVQGAKDTKQSGITLILMIIGIIILIFGIFWLVNVFKKKMSKSAGGKVSSSSVSAGAYKPPRSGGNRNGSTQNYRPMNLSQNNVKKQNNSGQRAQGKRKIYVEKNYRSSSKRSF